MTLKNARVGDTVKVLKVEGTGPIRRRIMDLGITKGVEIYIRKVAPLGDPFELTVRGYELSLRKEDAKMVLIEKLSSKKEEVANNVN
ncbi:MAG: ferrous iron transport protein A [Clostridia bacterium]|nr:ferrous iron transport protein A [Clostridia bacterium]